LELVKLPSQEEHLELFLSLGICKIDLFLEVSLKKYIKITSLNLRVEIVLLMDLCILQLLESVFNEFVSLLAKHLKYTQDLLKLLLEKLVGDSQTLNRSN
jgi:hypothetical protein